VTGSCEQGNEALGFIEGEEFLHQLSIYYRLKDSAPWSSLFSWLFS
jgi:hypothetical protein